MIVLVAQKGARNPSIYTNQLTIQKELIAKNRA